MTRNEARKQAKAHREQLAASAQNMRDAAARNAMALTSGEMIAASKPVGSFEQVSVEGTTTDGIRVHVTVYGATYFDKATRKATSYEARVWLREQRLAWEERHGHDHERLKLRGRIARLVERLDGLRGEAGDLVTDDTVGALADALALLNIAMETIGADGTALTIADAKRLVA